MFRGKTARTVVSLLAAVLLALPFFALTSPFAQAHTARHAEAKAQPGIKPAAQPARDAILTARPCGRSEKPFDPLGTRDRHRTTVTADPAPQQPERDRSAENASAGHHPARPADHHRHWSRSSTAHSPAALQVFRC
ncbi:hypothetical protein NFX46_09755 [Streptomyces phaeoluteigriseus]|uniref:Secreted protein n=1 Tax=Streptomyces phaeoluteigriseus TaxID=114686 RepID=A0ABY4Z6V3_9ACTN|nr:hypothetical protein [Streptomyces phaeoluteigriseus]USQ84057.1 hypothetical protein NFX46_09755 [Streptomyces phaeoluteigriseus]